MGYLAVLAANIFVSAPLAILVLAYSHLGTYNDSAKLGTALAYVGPLYLLLSMQHGVAILSGNRTAGQVAAIRLRCVPIFMVGACATAWALNEPILIFVAAFRLADFLYEPYFYGCIQARDGVALVRSSLGRLIVFGLALTGTQIFGAGFYAAILTIALVNGVVTVRPFFNAFEDISVASVSRVDFFLGLAAFLASVTMNIPRYFLVQAEPNQIAAYSNALTIVMAATLFFISLNNSFLASCAKQGVAGIRGFYIKSIAIFLALCVGSAVVFLVNDAMISRLLIRYALGGAYSSFYDLIFPFALLYCFLYLQNVINCIFVFLQIGRLTVLYNIVLILLFCLGFWLAFDSATAKRAIVIADVAMAIFLLFSVLSSIRMLQRRRTMNRV